MFYLIILFSILMLHFQAKYARIGKLMPCILLAVIYSVIYPIFSYSKLLILTMSYILLAMWVMALVSYFKRNSFT